MLPEETLLGTEELWQEHVFSLRPERTKHLSQIALAMHPVLSIARLEALTFLFVEGFVRQVLLLLQTTSALVQPYVLYI